MKIISKQPILDKVYEEMNEAEQKLVKRAFKSKAERDASFDCAALEFSCLTSIRALAGRIGNEATREFLVREIPELDL